MIPDTRIVLAPLAGGPSTPELAAAVSNAGGLGFLGGAYLSPDQLRQQIAATRRLTAGPIGVNLFVLRPTQIDEQAIAAYAREVGAEPRDAHFDDDGLGAKLEVVAEANVEVVSFTFGRPDDSALDRLDAEIWMTVTSAAEAAAAEGADALVVQGTEAGGHRGTWDDREDDTPLAELLAVIGGKPVIAAGGIGDREGVRAALEAGAAAVQVGTAFLLCPEAGTGEAYRRALATRTETGVTRAFTGRRGRGLVNRFMREHPDAPSAYPEIHYLTAPLRAAARAAGDAESFNLWAGTNVALARAEPAAEAVRRLRP